MSYTEEMLALRMFEHCMIYGGHMEESSKYASLCVEAARHIYAAIAVRYVEDEKDEELKSLEKQEAERSRRAAYRERRKAKLEELKQKEMEQKCYVVFKKYRNLTRPICFIIVSSRDVDAIKTEFFVPNAKMTHAGFYRISEEDSEKLFGKYADSCNDGRSKILACQSCGDFIAYTAECASAERIDLSDTVHKGCAIL